MRYIYSLFLDGNSLTGIARRLHAEGHKTASGKPNWSANQVRSVSTNEKYKGDALLRKSYINDFLTKKRSRTKAKYPSTTSSATTSRSSPQPCGTSSKQN